MWSHFWQGKTKQNSSHWESFCKGCVKQEQQLLQNAGTYDSADWQAEGQHCRNLFSTPVREQGLFEATALVVETYTRVMSYPGNPDTPQQRLSKERNVSQTMFEYLSCTNGFQNFEDARDQFEPAMGKDPIALWTALKASAGELALFAITILKVVVNQAGCERVFSDVGNIESPRRSRTALAKLEKITKVNAGIKADHLLEGFTPVNRQKRKNHKSVEKLLAVPRYRDLLEDQDAEDEDERGRALVGSTIGWRIEMAKWIADARAAEEADNSESEDEVESPTPISASTSRLRREKSAKWANTTLAVLFGGAPKPVRKFTPDDIDEEAELMEALADAEEDARLDDGFTRGRGRELPEAYCVEVLRHLLGVITAKYGQISDFKTFGKVKTAERDVLTRQLLSNGTKEALKESSWCTYEMQRLGKVSSKVWIWQPLPLPVLYPLLYLQRYTLTPGKP
ncbi:hypothetical protein K438DRAFT_2067454 [Mycena galopus ATCC 62051]|nr:hypothetical protein K438DRAFT_2067454 [Mycena galopus ATCC 62051]